MEDSARAVTIHQPEFMPWLGFFAKMNSADAIVLLDTVPFRKNYFQNRNRVRAENGEVWLTVPVYQSGLSGQLIMDVKMLDDDHWRRKHMATLAQSYCRLPAFEELWPELAAIYEMRTDQLVTLNSALIMWMARQFGIKAEILLASNLAARGKGSRLLVDLCMEVGASRYLSGPSGRDYLDVTLFDDALIEVEYFDFTHPLYGQRYQPFIPRLSAIDMLFCRGVEICRDWALSVIDWRF